MQCNVLFLFLHILFLKQREIAGYILCLFRYYFQCTPGIGSSTGQSKAHIIAVTTINYLTLCSQWTVNFLYMSLNAALFLFPPQLLIMKYASVSSFVT